MGPEIDEYAHSLLNTDDRAETILVVGHLVIDRVSFRLAGSASPGRTKPGLARRREYAMPQMLPESSRLRGAVVVDSPRVAP